MKTLLTSLSLLSFALSLGLPYGEVSARGNVPEKSSGQVQEEKGVPTPDLQVKKDRPPRGGRGGSTR